MKEKRKSNTIKKALRAIIKFLIQHQKLLPVIKILEKSDIYFKNYK